MRRKYKCACICALPLELGVIKSTLTFSTKLICLYESTWYKYLSCYFTSFFFNSIKYSV